MNTLAALSNLFVNKKLVGWLLTQSNDNTYTQGELDIQDAVADMVVTWMTDNSDDDTTVSNAAAILDILSGRADANSIYTRFEALGWNRTDQLRLFTIIRLSPGDDSQHIAERFLSYICDSAFVVNYNQWILYLINTSLTNGDSWEMQMEDILRKCNCLAVKSTIFYDVMDIRQNFDISDTALRFYSQNEPGIIDIQTIMLMYMLSLIRENAVTNLIHPAIGLLQAYDREHATSFADTLFVFLKNSGGFVDTAKELFIHRSTLSYRIEKIQSITQIDLEDFLTRVYLELSFLLDQHLTKFV